MTIAPGRSGRQAERSSCCATWNLPFFGGVPLFQHMSGFGGLVGGDWLQTFSGQGKKQSSSFLCEKDEQEINYFLAFSVLGMNQNGTMAGIDIANSRGTVAVWSRGANQPEAET